MNDSTRVTRGPWRASPAIARTVAAVIATAGLALLVAACSGRPGGSTSTNSGALAFSRCMRQNGVPNFPDPNGSGELPKAPVAQAASDPHYPAAARTCGHLLPNGGPGVAPSQGEQELVWTGMQHLTRCMRSHGVGDWPEPTKDTTGRPEWNVQGTGIDPNSQQISVDVRQCWSVMPQGQRPPICGDPGDACPYG